jgi:hypothetical protein
VIVKDHEKLAEVIVSLIQINEGMTKKAVVDSWNGDTSLVVAEALKDIAIDKASVSKSGVVTL